MEKKGSGEIGGKTARREQKRRRDRRRIRNYFRRRLDKGMRGKLAGLLLVVVLVFLCLLGRLTFISTVDGARYRRQVLSQSQSSYNSETLPYKRGDILDRNGSVLATSEKRYNVILDCRAINEKEDYLQPTVRAILSCFDVDEMALRYAIGDEKTRDSQYYVLLREVPVEQKRAFEDLKKSEEQKREETGYPPTLTPIPTETKEQRKERTSIVGVWFEETYRRIYPFRTLACNVIGFTNADGSAEIGLEGYYAKTLQGVDGRRFGYWNSGQTGENAQLQQTIIQPVDGDSIRTTLDVNIQKICEDELARFDSYYRGNVREDDGGAKNYGVIVMDPRDASILAMASSNIYDLNNPREKFYEKYSPEEIEEMRRESEKEGAKKNLVSEALYELWKNYCISSIYEPGSTFKPVTISAALETAKVDESDVFYCDGGELVSGITIHCSELEGHGRELLGDAIRNSCNDALMQIGSLLGVADFNRYQRIFHFGKTTGIDLSGEVEGILYTDETMKPINLATASFGQGFSCTMIQEAAAIASIANGGEYWQPHVAAKVMDSSGTVKKIFGASALGQTVSEDTADKVRSYMKSAVENGTAVFAKVNGYSMGGKTGTAEKLPRGEGKYLVSFIGFAPFDDPQVLIYVVVDEPNVEKQDDSRYAQWIARNILAKTLPYLNLYPDETLSADNAILLSDYDNPGGEPRSDSARDDEIPAAEGVGAGQEIPLGNTPEDLGYTNEEAGLGN